MTSLPAASRLRGWSQSRREPEWLTRRRLAALSVAEGAGLAVEITHPFSDERPLRAPLRAPELAAQGVEVSTLRSALESSPELVERHLAAAPKGSADEAAAALAEALWSDGYFVRVPAGVRAALPVQLGSDLARAAVERTLIVVEPGASLTLVEGCAGASGAAAERLSLLDAAVGDGASLEAASVQAWPPEVSYRAFKRVNAGARASVTWRDGNLGARKTDKRLLLSLARGAGAAVTLAGFAGTGQEQRLEARAGGGGTVALASRTAVGGGRLRSYLLAGPEAAVTRTEAELDLERLSEDELFYLATRGLEGREGRAAVLHAFFEPFSSRLPLEFSVEFTRLLDAELGA